MVVCEQQREKKKQIHFVALKSIERICIVVGNLVLPLNSRNYVKPHDCLMRIINIETEQFFFFIMQKLKCFFHHNLNENFYLFVMNNMNGYAQYIFKFKNACCLLTTPSLLTYLYDSYDSHTITLVTCWMKVTINCDNWF